MSSTTSLDKIILARPENNMLNKEENEVYY
jgi:hypothetical protein